MQLSILFTNIFVVFLKAKKKEDGKVKINKSKAKLTLILYSGNFHKYLKTIISLSIFYGGMTPLGSF
jgi:hypothetical protein